MVHPPPARPPSSAYTSLCPPSLARSTASLSSGVLMSALAPTPSKKRQASSRPASAAMCSAVLPDRVVAFTSTVWPLSIIACRHWTLPAQAAQCKEMRLLLSPTEALAPTLSRCLTTDSWSAPQARCNAVRSWAPGSSTATPRSSSSMTEARSPLYAALWSSVSIGMVAPKAGRFRRRADQAACRFPRQSSTESPSSSAGASAAQ
mmetsp:Transcript_64572/g.178489  ORF Transcript_64572/g.178489 Transcript_64572/m.178489 type:complete len:205 (+) Transcript_64572:232-846(+)